MTRESQMEKQSTLIERGDGRVASGCPRVGGRSGTPSSRTQLEELRFGRAGAGARRPRDTPMTGPARLTRSASVPAANDPSAIRYQDKPR